MPYQRLEIAKERDGWVMRMESTELTGSLGLHTHRELELNLVTGGEGVYIIKGGRYPIRSGTLLWLFPDQPHVLVDRSSDFSMWVAVMRPRLIKRLTDSAELAVLLSKDPGVVHVHSMDKRRVEYLETILRQLSLVQADDRYFNGGLGFLLRTAWEAGNEADLMAASNRIHPAVERATQLLQSDDLDCTLPVLAQKSGISYSRLCSLFTDQMGETLGDFRNSMRVERFRFLVQKHPKRTLLDLALEAGFGSYSQCHRTVCKHLGESPRELRHARNLHRQ